MSKNRVRLVGHVVELRRRADGVGGDKFAVGELCLVIAAEHRKLVLTRIANRGGRLHGVRPRDVEVLSADEGPFCARCGCFQAAACDGGCFWAEDRTRPMQDVCSTCVGRQAIAIEEPSAA